MWSDKDNDSAMNFYEGTSQWFPTWNGMDTAMQVGRRVVACLR